MKPLHIPISLGELIDKITILKIKYNNISSRISKKNIQNELEELIFILNNSIDLNSKLKKLEKKLSAINESLWDIEDQIREKEKEKEFDKEFILLARKVYFTNDERAKIKRLINKTFGSDLIEEKSYTKYN